jgi:predicted transcriptional regulator
MFPSSSSSLESLHQEMGKKLSEKATAAKKESEEFLQATTESLKKRVTEAEASLPSFMTGNKTAVEDKKEKETEKEKDLTENNNKWFGNNWKNPFQKNE